MSLMSYAFCPLCERSLKSSQSYCEVCQKHIEEARTKSSCHNSIYGDRIIYAFRYVGIIRQWMLKYKYGRQFALSKLFAKELWHVIQQHLDWKDLALVPVPTSWHKLFQRRYHPAELISFELHLCSQLKIFPKVLQKKWCWMDQSQSGLSRINRQFNPSLHF